MESKEKYTIVDSKGNEALADVSPMLLDFIREVNFMIHLYSAGRYTMADQWRDKLAAQLDRIMWQGNRG